MKYTRALRVYICMYIHYIISDTHWDLNFMFDRSSGKVTEAKKNDRHSRILSRISSQRYIYNLERTFP